MPTTHSPKCQVWWRHSISIPAGPIHCHALHTQSWRQETRKVRFYLPLGYEIKLTLLLHSKSLTFRIYCVCLSKVQRQKASSSSSMISKSHTAAAQYQLQIQAIDKSVKSSHTGDWEMGYRSTGVSNIWPVGRNWPARRSSPRWIWNLVWWRATLNGKSGKK